jgi:hypothetical protein
MRRAKGRVDDDWIERRSWTGWGDPRRVVEYDRGAHRLLGPIIGPPRPGGYRVPVPVVLQRDDGEIRVEVAGYRVGRLNAPAARDNAGLLRDAHGGRVTVPGLVVGGDEAHPQLEVRLWPERRLSDAIGVAMAHQRESVT